MTYDRQPAFNIDAKEVLNGDFHKGEGWEPNYITTSFGLQVNRAMIAGIVIETDEKKLILDDSTASITVQSYEPLESMQDIKPKDTILVVGKVRQYNGEQYIAPEIVSKISVEDVKYFNENKEKVKQLQESGKIVVKTTEANFSSGEDIVKEIVEEKVQENTVVNSVESVLSYIEKEDSGNGVEKVKILDAFPSEDIGDIIDTLILEGDIFEIKPHVFKVLK